MHISPVVSHIPICPLLVRSSPCTMPNIGGGVERTSAEPRLRRPGRRITFLECSRRLWHGYSWGVEAYLRAAPPHCSRDTLNNSRQYTFRGSTDHHPSPCVLRSRGLAVPLLRPLQCAFYVVAIRGNDHRSSFRSRSSTIPSTEIQSTISSTSVLRRVRSDAPVLHLHVPRSSTRTRVVRVWASLLLFIAHLSRMVHRLILLSVSSSSYGLWAHPVHHFHCLPPTPHGISEVNKWEVRPS